MSGVTKHIYEHDIIDIISMWNKELSTIRDILPIHYGINDIISMLKQFYPYEWQGVEHKYRYYNKKDDFLKKHKGRTRYNMESPEALLWKVNLVKVIMNNEYREQYDENYSEEAVEKARKELYDKRKGNIEKIRNKIEKAKLKTQQVTPEFLDQLIGLYERKNTSQKDRMYILLELKRYYNEKIIQFFFKLNDTELNEQLRWEAFYHLQSFNYQPRARSQKYMQIRTENMKRREYLKNEYINERYTIPLTPEELEYRIVNSKEQAIKTYDYFISHSSKDKDLVQQLIIEENKINKNIFCDWISDVDYLKRHLVCEATLKVIEFRLKQSKSLIFVVSESSKKSVWCKYELNYFHELNKPIFTITIKDIENGVFDLRPLNDLSFVDPNYKQLALIEGSRITAS